MLSKRAASYTNDIYFTFKFYTMIAEGERCEDLYDHVNPERSTISSYILSLWYTTLVNVLFYLNSNRIY